MWEKWINHFTPKKFSLGIRNVFSVSFLMLWIIYENQIEWCLFMENISQNVLTSEWGHNTNRNFLYPSLEILPQTMMTFPQSNVTFQQTMVIDLLTFSFLYSPLKRRTDSQVLLLLFLSQRKHPYSQFIETFSTSRYRWGEIMSREFLLEKFCREKFFPNP